MLQLFRQIPAVIYIFFLFLLPTSIETSTSNLKPSSSSLEDALNLNLWLTISAEKRFLEVSWENAPAREGDWIMLTANEPISFESIDIEIFPKRNEKNIKQNPFEDAIEGSGYEIANSSETTRKAVSLTKRDTYWTSNKGLNPILFALKPTVAKQWFTTGVYFDRALLRNVTIRTSCYGYWVSYVTPDGQILKTACLRAYPTWMNDLRSYIGGLRIRDLFVPGTHDSGSYRMNFDPLIKETVVTKYALAQDEDVHSQLMHGIRYLDIRIGYYRNLIHTFYINHGITRQMPLIDVINQVKDFVQETNEIVIFGMKEFPIGFGRNLTIHHVLVEYLKEHFGDFIVHPSATWRASLNDIWHRKQNVILAYDKASIVMQYPYLLFGSVEQRWGNVQTWPELENFLKFINSFDVARLSSRPVADMAELTPDAWGVIVNKYGGLRKMADRVNWRISQLYRDYLGANANIVAVDFYRGTNLVDLALEWNRKRTNKKLD
uniref:Phosphatidylinositol-specific phospholipase C X domain-containing protein n=1 Tax=Glossina pallidipes TaxID=7398 RepID=A0A1A9ZR28_GLOPL